jgi:hypothetical protein
MIEEVHAQVLGALQAQYDLAHDANGFEFHALVRKDKKISHVLKGVAETPQDALFMLASAGSFMYETSHTILPIVNVSS